MELRPSVSIFIAHLAALAQPRLRTIALRFTSYWAALSSQAMLHVFKKKKKNRQRQLLLNQSLCVKSLGVSVFKNAINEQLVENYLLKGRRESLTLLFRI